MRNAQSGASGNHTTWEIALTVTRITATHRAVELPVASPMPLRTMIAPRIRCTQPHVEMSAMIAPWPPTTTTWSLRIAASPHNASSEPTKISTIAAKTVQPVGWRS